MRSLFSFFGITYAISWTVFLAVAALPVSPEIRSVLILPGVFAPALVALAMTFRTDGKAGVGALLNGVFKWRVGAQWFVFAAGFMVAIKLSVALVHRLITGAWPIFGDEPWYLMVVATVISTPFQAGEEIGWRGYALPALASRCGFAWASILLGAIWTVWHLPLFFMPGADTQGQSFFLYVLQVTAVSVAITWLYVHTNGSLLLPMLFHAAVNNFKAIVPSTVQGASNPFGLSASRVAWLTVAMLWLFAIYFLARMPISESPTEPSEM